MKALMVSMTMFMAVILTACGSLGTMIPLNRNLTPAEVSYTCQVQAEKPVGVFGRIFNRQAGNYRSCFLPPLFSHTKIIRLDNQEIYGAEAFSVPMVLANLVGAVKAEGSIFRTDGTLIHHGQAWSLAPLFKYAQAYEYEAQPAGQKNWYLGFALDIFGYGRTTKGWFCKILLPFGPAAEDEKAVGLVMLFY